MRKQVITDEILKDIIKDYKQGMTPKEMSIKYSINDGTIISRLQSLKLYKNTTHRFTKEEKQYLIEHYPKDDIATILKHFPNVSKQSIIVYCSNNHIPSKFTLVDKWSNEDLYIVKTYYNEKSVNEIYNMIGKRHTKNAIQTKALRLFGYSKSRNWTKSEIDIMYKYYPNEPVDEVVKRLPKRSRTSVISKAMGLGIKSYSTILYQWTNEEKDYLSKNWKNMSDNQLSNVLKKDVRAIKDKRLDMGFVRCNHYNKATYDNLSKFLRGNIGSWKSESMEQCNYMCILTQSKDFAIHHLYSFSQIVSQTIEDNNIELKEKFNEYTKEELIYILEKFIELHNQYPLGVCVRKDIHDLFHRIYGTTTTPEMWNDFVNNYKKGNIQIN